MDLGQVALQKAEGVQQQVEATSLAQGEWGVEGLLETGPVVEMAEVVGKVQDRLWTVSVETSYAMCASEVSAVGSGTQTLIKYQTQECRRMSLSSAMTIRIKSACAPTAVLFMALKRMRIITRKQESYLLD